MKFQFFFYSLLLLPSLCSASYAKTTGFIYNDDVVCGYPFDGFIINDITCGTSASSHIVVEGVNDYNADEGYEQDVCHYGDRMEIAGEVTTMEAVAKDFDVYLHLCFKTYSSATGQSQWTGTSGSNGKKCYDFHTNLDLSLSAYRRDPYQYGDTYDENANYANNAYYADEYEYRNQNYDFLPEGTYTWKAFLEVPARTYRSVALMSATVTFHPTIKYLGPQSENGKTSYVWNGMSWHTYKTDCTLSFSGVHDSDDEDYAFSYVFAAGVTLLLASVGAGACIVRQRRFKCNRFNSRNGDEDAETTDFADGEASIISTDGTLWTLPLSRSMKRIKSLFNESDIGDEQSPDNFVEMEGQDGEIPEEEEGIEISEVYKHRRKSFIPRFFRRNR